MHEEEDFSEEDNDDELALLMKNFKKFLKKVSKFCHSPICLRVKNLLKTQIFRTIRREFNVGNVKISGIFNPSVQ